jgi:hypothetical protein
LNSPLAAERQREAAAPDVSGLFNRLKPFENTSSRNNGLSAVRQSEIASARRTVFSLASSPPAGACGELIADARPVAQRDGIEICAVRPHESSNLRIQRDAIENHKVLERAEQRAMKHRRKVDLLPGAVAEAHGQLVRANHFETDDTDDRMRHLPQWLNLDRRLTGLQQGPIVLKFVPMDFHPGSDEPFLRLGQGAAKTLDRVNGENGRMFLVIRVEMGPMVRLAGLDVHSDDDSEKSREFRHPLNLPSSSHRRGCFPQCTRGIPTTAQETNDLHQHWRQSTIAEHLGGHQVCVE